MRVVIIRGEVPNVLPDIYAAHLPAVGDKVIIKREDKYIVGVAPVIRVNVEASTYAVDTEHMTHPGELYANVWEPEP